jgi:hypothetical protein
MTVSEFTFRPRLTRDNRPDIKLGDGRILTPRTRLAEECGISDRNAARKLTEVFYIGGVAYADRASGLKDIVGKPQRRNQPPRKRASAKT